MLKCFRKATYSFVTNKKKKKDKGPKGVIVEFFFEILLMLIQHCLRLKLSSEIVEGTTVMMKGAD